MRTDRKGTAAVEFALVAPLLCVMILGMLEIGRALQVQQALTNAVREGCRGYCDNTTTVTFNGQTYTVGTSSLCNRPGQVLFAKRQRRHYQPATSAT